MSKFRPTIVCFANIGGFPLPALAFHWRDILHSTMYITTTSRTTKLTINPSSSQHKHPLTVPMNWLLLRLFHLGNICHLFERVIVLHSPSGAFVV